MSLLVRGVTSSGLCSVRLTGARGYWWGHDTVQDKENRQKLAESKRIIKWIDPVKIKDKNVGVSLDKGRVYAPARILEEANTLNFTKEDKSYMDYTIPEILDKLGKPILPYLTNYDYFKNKLLITHYNRLIRSQLFIRERFTTLGPDLAAAQFLCWRGCRVRFKGHDHWTALDGFGRLNIPDHYQPGYYIEAIDAAGSHLIYEGFQNLRNLTFLRYLDLSYCPHIDAFCLDRITGEYRDTLEYLDLSGCPLVDWNGVEVLWRLRNLKTLVLYDLEHIKDLPLICLMLLDLNPNLDIRGVDYIDTSLLEGTEHEHLLEDLDTLALSRGEVLQIEQAKEHQDLNVKGHSDLKEKDSHVQEHSDLNSSQSETNTVKSN